jgi:3-oxoacyl-[acyl-carrier protein] reductase
MHLLLIETRCGVANQGEDNVLHNSNKVAIVTGASRGIGAAIAERLAKDGFTVVVNYSGDAAPAEALVRKIEEAGGKALTAKADVSDAEAVRRMFDAAEAAFGGVDVLVNNAGIMMLSSIADSDDACSTARSPST